MYYTDVLVLNVAKNVTEFIFWKYKTYNWWKYHHDFKLQYAIPIGINSCRSIIKAE